MHSKIVHKHEHRIVNCIEQLSNKILLSGNLVSVLTWTRLQPAIQQLTFLAHSAYSCLQAVYSKFHL